MLWTRDIPDDGADQNIAHVKVARTDAIGFAQEQGYGHGIDVGVSSDRRGTARAGNREEAERLLAQSKSQYVSPYYIAMVYLGLGKNDMAMNWLEKAYADR
jgi:hypothetical protein